MNFTYRCLICKQEFKKRIRHKEHLESHNKIQLINALKHSGFYHEN